MNYSKGKPNIFNFATTELSQDAFICWLVSWLNHPEIDPQMYDCAKDFIVRLYNNFNNRFAKRIDKIIQSDVGNLIKTKINEKEEYVLRQYQKIDVYFRVKIKDKTVSFIIEDKTHTSHHSDQLKKYKKRIKYDGIHEDETIMIYFKTGYPFQQDQEVSKYGYYPLFYDEWWDKFISKYDEITNPLFSAYRDYFYSNYYHHYKSNLKILYDNNGFDTFYLGFTQYEFLKDLRDKCPDYHNDKSVYTGTSFGRPWAQYSFIEFRNYYGDKNEYVFYRLDAKGKYPNNKSPYYLSIRQYADIDKKDNNVRKIKLERLKVYKSIFKECQERFIKDIEFEETIRRDWSGAKESEIACLHFDPVINTTTNVLYNIGRFHSQFVEKIKKSDL